MSKDDLRCDSLQNYLHYLQISLSLYNHGGQGDVQACICWRILLTKLQLIISWISDNNLC